MKQCFLKTVNLFKAAQSEEVFPGGILSLGNKKGEITRCITGYKSVFHVKEYVDEGTLFDMASLTKVMSTTMTALKLLECGKLSLQDTLDFYFSDVPKDKKDITILQLMTHTSGLKADMPLYKLGIKPKDAVNKILESELQLKPGTNVVYSCLGYILLGKILESLACEPLDALSKKYVFDPLKMYNTGYNPKSQNVASTEYSEEINGCLKGVVHDENARFLGGVSGNAGVFSDIADMNRFAEMLSNGGIYKNIDYLCENTFRASVKNYTDGMNEHRGLGFSLKDNRIHPAGDLFSLGSYGHTGFTGTSLWIDRETGFYVICITNRVHPSRENSRIIRFRRLLHNLAITEYKSTFK